MRDCETFGTFEENLKMTIGVMVRECGRSIFYRWNSGITLSLLLWQNNKFKTLPLSLYPKAQKRIEKRKTNCSINFFLILNHCTWQGKYER